MLVGDFVEDYEVMVPFQMLIMVGHTVHAVCPDNRQTHCVYLYGQQILAAADIIEGRLCNSYPAVKPEVIRAVARWGAVNADYSNAYVDGKLVTAAAWPGHPEWMRKFLEVLGARIEP